MNKILEKKGDALPNWMAENFNSADIINAIKRHENPNWGGVGSGESLRTITISKEKYSWSELKRTPKGILAVLAWELEVRKADFVDAKYSELHNSNGVFEAVNTSKLNALMLSGITSEEE